MNTAPDPVPRIFGAGTRGLMFDPACSAFSQRVQDRLLALATLARQYPGVEQAVPGMNNLLLVLEPGADAWSGLSVWLADRWLSDLKAQVLGRTVEVPVVYGGPGSDLAQMSSTLGLSLDTVVHLHSDVLYHVACVGAMPGFAYLSGLDPRLAIARRATPRMRLERGAVILGAGQAGIMPIAAPSGWHVLGHAQCQLFDAQREPATLLRPGDRVRFTVQEVRPC